LFILFNFAACG